MTNEHFSPFTNRWKVLPRGDVGAQFSRNHVSLNKKGAFHIGQRTHERLGSPTHYLIKLDEANNMLALEPATHETKNAYPARGFRDRGSKVVRAFRLITEWNIKPQDTIEFVKPRIDPDGVLILNMRNIRLSPRAHSQCRKKKAEAAITKAQAQTRTRQSFTNSRALESNVFAEEPPNYTK
jgi:hypothetical protein